MIVKVKNSQDEIFPVFGIERLNNKMENILVFKYSFTRFLKMNDLEIIHPEISHFWVKRTRIDRSTEFIPEYEEEYFCENLSNSAPREVKLCNIYNEILLCEFPRQNEDEAIVLHEKYCQCPECCDYWENYSFLGMVRCPTCRKILLNPFGNEDMVTSSCEVENLHFADKYKNWYYCPHNRSYFQEPPSLSDSVRTLRKKHII